MVRNAYMLCYTQSTLPIRAVTRKWDHHFVVVLESAHAHRGDQGFKTLALGSKESSWSMPLEMKFTKLMVWQDFEAFLNLNIAVLPTCHFKVLVFCTWWKCVAPRPLEGSRCKAVDLSAVTELLWHHDAWPIQDLCQGYPFMSQNSLHVTIFYFICKELKHGTFFGTFCT